MRWARRLVDEAGLEVGVEGGDRRPPVAVAGGILEQRLAGPADPRRRLGRLRGEMPGRLVLVLALGLDEQAVQAEEPGVGAAGERLEGAAGARPVAGELRRLRGEQQHQRLRPEQRAGIVRRPAGQPRRPLPRRR